MTTAKTSAAKEAKKVGLTEEQLAQLRDLALRKGTRAARGALRQLTGKWWKGAEIRELLGLDFDRGALLAQQAHRAAWGAAGWRAGRWWTRPT